MYCHKSISGQVLPFNATKVVCIGQNYADHIAELSSVARPEPLFFHKPITSLCPINSAVKIPRYQGECHNELEIAVLIKNKLNHASEAEVGKAIWGYGLALDLTLRDIQSRQKKQGRPWEVAKSFDNSCPISSFVPVASASGDMHLTLQVNGELRQSGHSGQMICSVTQLISEMSQHFTLCPGDVVLTGTPAGVGPLKSGDVLVSTLSVDQQTLIRSKTQII
jgi:2-keto-4-pentenoate hydratase/2-oxohepta-3-ene-1,7-dioic acid hydratase in catechol pathway